MKITVNENKISIEGYGHFNMRNVSYVSDLVEYCDGPNYSLYFMMDNVRIEQEILDSDVLEQFTDLYNRVLFEFVKY